MEWNAYQVAKDSGDFMLAVRSPSCLVTMSSPQSMLGSFRCQDPQQRERLLQSRPSICLLQQAADTLDSAPPEALNSTGKAEQLLMEEMPDHPRLSLQPDEAGGPRPARACRASNLKGADRHQGSLLQPASEEHVR